MFLTDEASPMNFHERRIPMAGEAVVEFLDSDFRVVKPGAFVRCAVTGEPIAIEDLRYWSVARQEAYADAEASLKRHLETRRRSRPA
jgi:hypothetical protein